MRTRRARPFVLSSFALVASVCAIGVGPAGAQTPEEDAEHAVYPDIYCASMTLCTDEEIAEGKKLRCLTITECEKQEPSPSLDPAIKEGFDRERTRNQYAYKKCRTKAKQTVDKRKRQRKLKACVSKYPAVIR